MSVSVVTFPHLTRTLLEQQKEEIKRETLKLDDGRACNHVVLERILCVGDWRIKAVGRMVYHWDGGSSQELVARVTWHFQGKRLGFNALCIALAKREVFTEDRR